MSSNMRPPEDEAGDNSTDHPSGKGRPSQGGPETNSTISSLVPESNNKARLSILILSKTYPTMVYT